MRFETRAVLRDGFLPVTVLVGTSRVALDVLSSVASEYLFNVGRTIKFFSDKYARSMSPEVGI